MANIVYCILECGSHGIEFEEKVSTFAERAASLGADLPADENDAIRAVLETIRHGFDRLDQSLIAATQLYDALAWLAMTSIAGTRISEGVLTHVRCTVWENENGLDHRLLATNSAFLLGIPWSAANDNDKVETE